MRIFDCILYNGEIEVLLLRLHELKFVVDVFVIVESTKTFSGLEKELHLRAQWAKIRQFARKIRYIVVSDDIAEGGPWDREHFHRNSITRGLLDAKDSDLICASDVDEIPKADVIRRLKERDAGFFGFKLKFSYFFLNYRNTSGPEANFPWSCAFPKQALKTHTPDQLRYGIRNGSIPAEHIEEAGWHFSYLADVAGVKQKIAAFSHQEFNTPEFLNKVDIPETVRRREDFFSRPGFVWEIVGIDDLPSHVRANPQLYGHHIVKLDGIAPRRTDPRGGWRARTAGWLGHRLGLKVIEDTRPIIICPYLHNEDMAYVINAFGLDRPSGRHLPFFFAKDEKLIGPEKMFEHCWKQFPQRDVIIVHTDMRPMPDDENNGWYADLCAQEKQLPSAGLIGCDLLYPLKSPGDHWYVQCAGGFFKDGKLGHIGGGVQLAEGTATADAYEYDGRYSNARSTGWVTFGGVYIRRETIDMVGGFDPRYQWAYVMDVDYCLEARTRGLEIYQVPVNLLHEESKSSKKFLMLPEYQAKVQANMDKFNEKWASYLAESVSEQIEK